MLRAQVITCRVSPSPVSLTLDPESVAPTTGSFRGFGVLSKPTTEGPARLCCLQRLSQYCCL